MGDREGEGFNSANAFSKSKKYRFSYIERLVGVKLERWEGGWVGLGWIGFLYVLRGYTNLWVMDVNYSIQSSL